MKNLYQVPALETYRTLCGRQHRRRRFIGHVLHLPTSQSGDRLDSPEGAEEAEDGAGQRGHGRIHVEKICKKWVSVAVTLMKPRALPVIVLNGDNSSPSVPVGT